MYNNIKLINFGHITNNDLLEFNTKENITIRSFLSSKNISCKIKNKVINFDNGNSLFPSGSILKLSDDWFIFYYSSKEYHMEYYKCDELGGLIHQMNIYLSDIPTIDPNILINKENDNQKIISLRKEINNKIKILSYEELSKLNNQL